MNYPMQTTQPIYPTNAADPVGNQAPDAQQYRRRMMMGLQLMGQQANPTTPYAGLANVGSSLAGAQMYHNAANNMAYANQGISPVSVTPAVNASFLDRARTRMGNMFSLGGG